MVFPLDEYRLASQAFIQDAVEALVVAGGGPVLGMPVEKVPFIPRSRHTFESGEVIERTSGGHESVVSFTFSDAVAGDLDEVHEAVLQMATDRMDAMMSYMAEFVNEVTEATGQIVDAKDRPFWDAYLDGLEIVKLSFDENGAPHLPILVSGSRTDPPAMKDEDLVRLEQIIDGKRSEWMATRSSRRLPEYRDRTRIRRSTAGSNSG